MGSYLNKLFWTSFRSKPGGITVYRGYSAALRGSGHEKKLSASAPGSRRGSTSSRRGSTSSNISAGNEDKKDKDKDKEAEPKDKPKEKTKAKSGLRKSLDFAIGSAGLKKSQPPLDNSEAKSDLLVPPPQPRPNRQVSQIMEESLNGQGETYQKKKPQVKDALDEEQIPMTADEDDAEECTDLILVIHGIGTPEEGRELYLESSSKYQLPRRSAARDDVRRIQLCLCDQHAPTSYEVGIGSCSIISFTEQTSDSELQGNNRQTRLLPASYEIAECRSCLSNGERPCSWPNVETRMFNMDWTTGSPCQVRADSVTKSKTGLTKTSHTRQTSRSPRFQQSGRSPIRSCSTSPYSCLSIGSR